LVAKFLQDETLAKWGLSMNQDMAELKGKKLPQPQIVDKENRATGF